MEKFFRVVLLAGCILISACASSVQRQEGDADYQYRNEKFSKVELTVAATATKDANDRVRFDDKALCRMIERKLEVGNLVDTGAADTVKVVITDVRVRSSFNAFMWGFMAGDDHIVGQVSLVDAGGTARHTFNVSANYALGGLAGLNETRMSWLFEEFSKLTVEEIIGRKSAGSQ